MSLRKQKIRIKQIKRHHRQLSVNSAKNTLRDINSICLMCFYLAFILNNYKDWRKHMATAIYARQSIDKKDSLSIEAQIDICKKECNNENQFLIYTDKGYSGKNTDRPQFCKMMQDVKGGLIDKVVVYRLDRLSRSITDFGQMWEELNNYNVAFTSVSEKFDTETPVGRAMIYIIMVFAQLERETIAERVKDNYYERAKYGTWLGGPAPFGFNTDRINISGKSVPTLITNEDIKTVEKMFYTYIKDNESLGSIAKMLSKEGVFCGKRKAWDNVAVSRILHSPLYVQADIDVYTYYRSKGITKFANEIEEFDGTHAAQVIGKRDASTRKYSDFKDHVVSLMNFQGIIPSEIWLECQYKLDRNRQLKNTGKGKNSWLTGLLKCASCGYAIIVKKGYKNNLFLACSGHYNIHICDKKEFLISIKEIEDAVQTSMEEILAKCHNDSENEPVYNSKQKMELTKIEEKIEKLVGCIAESTEITISYLNKEIEKLDAQRRKILNSMTSKQKNEKYQLGNIVFKNLDNMQKHQTAEAFIEKILVDIDSLEIVWKV